MWPLCETMSGQQKKKVTAVTREIIKQVLDDNNQKVAKLNRNNIPKVITTKKLSTTIDSRNAIGQSGYILFGKFAFKLS